MVGSIASGTANNVSSLQTARALSAFKQAAQAGNENANKNNDINDVAEVDGKQYKSAGASVADKVFSPQKQQFISEFKKFTQQYSQMGISDAEILNALKYGNSVLVNQVC